MVKYREHNEEVCNLCTLQIAEQKEFGMKKREQYKGLIRFWAAAILVLLQTGSFAYVWFAWYGDLGILFAMLGVWRILRKAKKETTAPKAVDLE